MISSFHVYQKPEFLPEIEEFAYRRKPDTESSKSNSPRALSCKSRMLSFNAATCYALNYFSL